MAACFQNSGGTSGANAATPAETLGSERTVDSHTTDASPAFHDHAKYASVTTAAARPSARRRFPCDFPAMKTSCASQNAPYAIAGAKLGNGAPSANTYESSPHS